MDKFYVAVLFGGQSPEHEVSVMSGESIMAALSAAGFAALPVYITRDGRWLLHDAFTEKPKAGHWKNGGIPAVISPDASHGGLLRLGAEPSLIKLDAVFPALHGKTGEDGSIQGLCQLAGIPCVGSGVLSTALCMDKAAAKLTAAVVTGLEQTPYLVFHSSLAKDTEDIAEAAAKARAALGFPCFVKPANAGSSLGISKAADEAAFAQAFREAAVHDEKIIAERAVVGRELEVGVLGNDSPIVSGVGEIAAAEGFYDYDSKYRDGRAEIIVPAVIPADISDLIRRQALAVYRAMGCAGMARVDFFLEHGTNRVLFNEINTIPGFTPYSMYPRLMDAAGFPMPSLVSKLVELAVKG